MLHFLHELEKLRHLKVLVNLYNVYVFQKGNGIVFCNLCKLVCEICFNKTVIDLLIELSLNLHVIVSYCFS